MRVEKTAYKISLEGQKVTAGGRSGSTVTRPCLAWGSVLTITRTSSARNLFTLGRNRVNTNTTWCRQTSPSRGLTELLRQH